jgi:dUTP pyrophosphatase
MIKVKVKLNADIALPLYQTAGSAGFDLASSEDITILAGQTVAVKTGLCLAIPEGYELQIRSRSGMALKHNVFVLNAPGTIDCDFRGEIMVILSNAGSNYTIKKGDRIAQGVLKTYEQAEFEVVSTLDETARAEKGFGSTGN